MKTRIKMLIGILAIWVEVGLSNAQTWTLTSATATNWTALASSADGSQLIAVASGGLIYKSVDFGTNWSPTSAPTSAWQAVASSADGVRLVAAADGGGIYTSPDAGGTWIPANAPATNWFAIASSGDGQRLVAAVSGNFVPFGGPPPGLIYVSTDAGTNWTATSAPALDWTSVASSADGTKLFAVPFSGGPSEVFFSRDGGTGWATSSVPTTAYLTTLACSADGSKCVAGSSDPFHFGGGGWPLTTSTNSGLTWSATLAPGPARPCIAGSADGCRWIAAAQGSLQGNVGSPIYLSTDSGATWTATDSPNTNWSCLACSADGYRLVAAIKGGGIWTTQSTPAPMLNVTRSGTNLLLSWVVSSMPFVVQANSDLLTTNWTDITNAPSVDVTNLQCEVSLPIVSDKGFYRLKHQF